MAAPVVSFRWGSDGHKITGLIARQQLTPQAAAVGDLLKGEGGTLAEVSTWADEVRRQYEYAWSAPLHFVNIPSGAAGYDAVRDCRDGKCVVAAIKRYTAVLRDSNSRRQDKIEALKFLVHFVGDIHQPLQAIKEGKGANDYKVFFFTQNTNLHSVWDSGIIRRALRGQGWTVYGKEIQSKISSQRRQQWARQLDPAAWANESYELAYKTALLYPKSGELGQDYFDRNRPIVEQRLTMAEIRLAALLNQVFSPGRATRPAAASQSAPLEPSQTVHRAMKGIITSIDQDKREFAFHWHDAITNRDLDLTIAIRPGALLQVNYKDVGLNTIKAGPGRETTLMVKIENLPEGGQRLTATAIRQNEGAGVPAK